MIFWLVKLWRRIFKYVAWGYLDLEYKKVELKCRTLSYLSGLLETMLWTQFASAWSRKGKDDARWWMK